MVKKILLPMGIAALMAATLPVQALAASPEFSRTPEEWAQLRDNIMEYEELAGLIREYNVTVLNNQIDYNTFRQDYGVTKEDVAKKYRDMANEILDHISYPDSDDLGYGTSMAVIVQNEKTAKDLRKQADDNIEDSMVMWLTSKSAEDTLVSVAQTNMISYHQKQLELKVAQQKLELLSAQYNSSVVKQGIGMATQLDVLTAQEDVQNAEKDILTLSTDIKNGKQKLNTMLGWKFDSEPEIRAIPRADLEKIDQIDPQQDKLTAIENNYTLLANKRKLENATDAATKDSLNNSINDNQEKINSSVMTAYHSVLTSKIDYERAIAEAALEAQNMAVAEQKLQLGQMSRLDYQQQQFNYLDKQTNQEITDMKLVQALESYDWAVKGLASAQ